MSKPTEKQAPKPVLRFFPEGGSIVEGTTCMVAFEATTTQGDSLDVEGDIIDRQGKVVARFQSYHRGLGFFPLTAEAGQQYTAVCRDRGGHQYKFPLPPARQDAASLRCRVTSNEVEVRANCGAGLASKPFFLLVHCRGQLVSLKQVRAGATYRLPLNLLPAGINSLMLLDNQCRVLSFRGLNYPDDADVFIYALRQKKKRCLVETDKTYTPHAPDVSVTHRSTRLLPWMDIDNDLLEQYARDSHLLQEVVVKGHNRYGGYPLDNTTWSLDRRQIEEGEYPDVGFMLLCSNILNVGAGRITADDMYKSDIDRLFKTDRRSRQVIKSTQPSSEVKLYVNGMHIPNLTYEDIELEDIDRIDLYMGSKAWVFGEDMVSGVVNITTRNGINRTTNDIFNNKKSRKPPSRTNS